MKKFFILFLNFITGILFYFFIFIIINSSSKYFPYRFAEKIYESNSATEILILIILSFFVICFLVFKDFKKINNIKIKNKIFQIFVLIAIFLVFYAGMVLIIKNIFKVDREKFNELVNLIVSDFDREKIEIYNNDYNFEYFLISEGMFLEKKEIEKQVADKNIAYKLEYKTYNSDSITIKAIKERKVFRKELISPRINLGNNYFIVKNSKKLKIYKIKKDERILIYKIE